MLKFSLGVNPSHAVHVSKLFATQSIYLPNFEQIDYTLMWSRGQFKADDIFATWEGLKKTFYYLNMLKYSNNMLIKSVFSSMFFKLHANHNTDCNYLHIY